MRSTDPESVRCVGGTYPQIAAGPAEVLAICGEVAGWTTSSNRTLRQQGLDGREIRRMQRDGALVPILHGLPIWAGAAERVQVKRDRVGGGNRRSIVQVHGAPLVDPDRTVIDGVPVTSLLRTVLDLCRTLLSEQAVAAGDRALAHGLVK